MRTDNLVDAYLDWQPRRLPPVVIGSLRRDAVRLLADLGGGTRLEEAAESGEAPGYLALARFLRDREGGRR